MRSLLVPLSSFAVFALFSSSAIAESVAPAVPHATPAVAAPAAKLPTGATQGAGVTPRGPNTVVRSFKTPAPGKPTIAVQSWGEIEDGTLQLPHHAMRVDVGGTSYGTQIEVSVQEHSQIVEVPRAKRAPDVDPKTAKATFDKELAGAVGKAVNERNVLRGMGRAQSPTDPFTMSKSAHHQRDFIPPNAPVTLTARDLQNRPLTPARTTAEGAPRTLERGTSKSGEEAIYRYQPWVNIVNVYSTSTYERGGKTFAKLLGLAAFPRNATVKLTNTRLRAEGAAEHTVVLDGLNASGSGSVEVPALNGDLIELEVSYPDVPGRAYGAAVKTYYTVPTKTPPNKVVMKTNTGMPYVRVEEAVVIPPEK